MLSFSLGSNCSSVFLGRPMSLCVFLPLLTDFTGPATIWPWLGQNNNKNPSYGVELWLISESRTGHSQNPLKQFCLFSSCERNGFKSALPCWTECFSMLLFFFKYLVFSYVLEYKIEHCRALFSNVKKKKITVFSVCSLSFTCNWYLTSLWEVLECLPNNQSNNYGVNWITRSQSHGKA